MIGGHRVTLHGVHDWSHDECGNIVHRPYSNCISSIEKSNRNSIEFSLSNAEQRVVGFILAWSLAPLQRAEGPSIEGEYRGNTVSRGGNQLGLRRDPNAMDVDRGRGGDRMCYVCGKWDHMAKNCWKRHKERIVETLQELTKENGGQ